MPKLSFLHFDTRLKDNQNDDPFQCSLTLASPIRDVKKIYLKSCEIPVGFFNIRERSDFTFTLAPSNPSLIANGPITTTTPVIQSPVVLTSVPNSKNNYMATQTTPTRDIVSFKTEVINVVGLTYPTTFTITIVPGNYTVDTLISYINTEIASLYDSVRTTAFLGYPAPIELTKLLTNDSGAYPVGLLKLNYSSLATVSIISQNFFTNTVLGFQTNQTDNVNGYIIAKNFWGLYNDLSINLYIPNIPHNNTHFGSQLVSFKIAMNSGYQSIHFSSDNQNFSQFIEISDTHYIINTIKLAMYDTQGALLFNQYDWNFTLGFET
jgi:hypothetical protein